MKTEHNVFVIDDDKSSRNGLARLMRVGGYHVFTYASATEFLLTLNSTTLGCVLLDARILKISAEEIASKLINYGENLSIIFVTAHDDPETKRKAREMKAVGFFRKPVDGIALLDAIGWVLNSDHINSNDKKMFEG